MHKKYFLLPILCLTIYSSCKKAIVESVQLNNSKDSLTYQPKVPGSRWVYKRTVAAIGVSTYNFVRLTQDTSAYGFTFNVFSNDADANQYIRQDGGKYYSILTASTNKPALLILDTAKNINESWVGGVNGSDTYTYTMKQKIPVYTLDGFTFKNVLVIHAERTTTSGASTLSGDSYYAQGVGLVLTQGTVSGVPVEVRLKDIFLQ